MNQRTPGGRQAIELALESLYPGQVPSRMVDEGDLVPIISGYFCRGPAQHWHLVTHGLTVPIDRKPHGANRSEAGPRPNGYGFELTMRIPYRFGEQTPPDWAFGFLQNLAAYVFRSGNLFRVGDYMNLNGPITKQEPTLICSVMLIKDATLPTIGTADGDIQLLQVVGITADEEAACKLWFTTGLAELFGAYLPALVTDIRRASLMGRPEIRTAVETGSLRDGSRTGHIYADDKLSWSTNACPQQPPRLRVTIGALQWAEVVAMLERRIPFGRQFLIIGPLHRVVFEPAEVGRRSVDGSIVKLQIRHESVHTLRTVVPARAGIYAVDILSDGLLEIEIVKSEIRSSDGRIVETIG